MPEWANQIALAVLAAITGGTEWLFKSWREDKNKRLEAQAAYVAALEARNEKLIEKVQSLLVDAKVEALENKAERSNASKWMQAGSSWTRVWSKR
jgi:hypothetical protein